ncbi:unnamed protein product [Phaedon cochleariae]|uniref:Uncharacterized protein n=1 Tax=Phaedon cochleariae TaxID=80249 RepID=A0A9N9X366_PHACE|nr:unnamed protein product [Phaedon cochleariae]
MVAEILFKSLVLIAAVVRGYEFPEAFKRCRMNDKDFEICLAKTIENAFQLIGSSGIPSLSLPSIDPIQITSLEIGAGTSAVNLVQKYKDVKVYGFSKNKVEEAHMDFDKKILTFTTLYPELRQEGKYSVNGKILVIPVFGTGDSVIQLMDPRIVHTVVFKELTKNGKKHFHVEDYKLGISIKGAHYDFQNLFDGDKKLADNILKVINENWNVIFEDVRAGVETAYSAVCKAMANRLFDTVPVDDIFLK